MSNSFEFTGTIKEVFEAMTFASGFTKREFLLTIDDDYPQDIKFQCLKERVAQLDHVQAGSRVKVKFRVSCRAWDSPAKGTQYFTDLVAYQVDALEGDGSTIAYEAPPSEFQPSAEMEMEPSDDDILPF